MDRNSELHTNHAWYDLRFGDCRSAHNDASTNTSVFDNLGTLLSLVGPTVNVLPPATTLSLASGGKLDLSGHNQQVASLSDYVSGNGGSILNSNSGAASVLTVSPTGGSTTFSGTIVGGGTLGTISLVMNGNGTQVLSGSNTYTGGTSINQGVLTFANRAALPSSGTTFVAAGATLGLGVSSTNTTAFFSAADLDALFAGRNLLIACASISDIGIDTTAGDFRLFFQHSGFHDGPDQTGPPHPDPYRFQ